MTHFPIIACILLFFTWNCGNQPVNPEARKATLVSAPEPVKVDTVRVPAMDKNYLLGKFDPNDNPDFEIVGKPYADKSGMILRKETLEAFKKMADAARKDGVHLKVISSTRNFAQQKAIWEGKWSRFAKAAPAPKDRALKILEFSSMPGSSRHHWGTDVDLNDLNNSSFEKGGTYEAVYKWLSAHAPEYGFCQPYTAGRATGYHEEKWHWSYTPLSSGFLKQYKTEVHDTDIQGFLGAEMAVTLHIKDNYVFGINEACK